MSKTLSEVLKVRPVVSDDVGRFISLDHHTSTDHVWQMGFSQNREEVAVRFNQVRLPRLMRVHYPRDPQWLAEHWRERDLVLVAEYDQQLHGYLALNQGPGPAATWVTDLVVDLASRRRGVATRLLAEARAWSFEHGFHKLVMEMQAKNFPAISLAQKLGFAFSGYSDQYYPDQEIALFFTLPVR